LRLERKEISPNVKLWVVGLFGAAAKKKREVVVVDIVVLVNRESPPGLDEHESSSNY